MAQPRSLGGLVIRLNPTAMVSYVKISNLQPLLDETNENPPCLDLARSIICRVVAGGGVVVVVGQGACKTSMIGCLTHKTTILLTGIQHF